jgi:hypothetical protein
MCGYWPKPGSAFELDPGLSVQTVNQFAPSKWMSPWPLQKSTGLSAANNSQGRGEQAPSYMRRAGVPSTVRWSGKALFAQRERESLKFIDRPRLATVNWQNPKEILDQVNELSWFGVPDPIPTHRFVGESAHNLSFKTDQEVNGTIIGRFGSPTILILRTPTACAKEAKLTRQSSTANGPRRVSAYNTRLLQWSPVLRANGESGGLPPYS